MRKLFMWAVMLAVVVSLALPMAVMATEGESPPIDSMFGLDLVTFAVLAGVVVAVSDYFKDLFGVAGKSQKLLIVLLAGFAVTAFEHFYGLDSWVMRSLIVPVSAAGYYKVFNRQSSTYQEMKFGAGADDEWAMVRATE